VGFDIEVYLLGFDVFGVPGKTSRKRVSRPGATCAG
jgi:hypothetical protein